MCFRKIETERRERWPIWFQTSKQNSTGIQWSKYIATLRCLIWTASLSTLRYPLLLDIHLYQAWNRRRFPCKSPLGLGLHSKLYIDQIFQKIVSNFILQKTFNYNFLFRRELCSYASAWRCARIQCYFSCCGFYNAVRKNRGSWAYSVSGKEQAHNYWDKIRYHSIWRHHCL